MGSPRPDALYLAFRGAELLVRVDGDEARLPDPDVLTALGIEAPRAFPVPAHHDTPVFVTALPEPAGAAAPAPALPDGHALLGLRRLHGRVPASLFRLAGRAFQLLEWHRTHRHCGICGAPTVYAPGDEARRCPACGAAHFPRVTPAVIVLVEREDTVLLARSPHFAPGVFSALAGYVEPGETLEEAVAREVAEEVGIEVRDVRFFGSQSWPFPHTLMVGFTARYAGGTIRLDEREIEAAGWFRADGLPGLPTSFSIARTLLEDWRARRNGSAAVRDEGGA